MPPCARSPSSRREVVHRRVDRHEQRIALRVGLGDVHRIDELARLVDEVGVLRVKRLKRRDLLAIGQPVTRPYVLSSLFVFGVWFWFVFRRDLQD